MITGGRPLALNRGDLVMDIVMVTLLAVVTLFADEPLLNNIVRRYPIDTPLKACRAAGAVRTTAQRNTSYRIVFGVLSECALATLNFSMALIAAIKGVTAVRRGLTLQANDLMS